MRSMMLMSLSLSPVSLFVSVPLTWMAWCVAIRALFLLRPLAKFADVAVVIAGPGLLLISRGGPLLIHAAALSIPVAIALGMAAAIAAAFALRRLVPQRFKEWRSGTALALVWLMVAVSLLIGHDRHAARATRPVVDAPAGAPNVLLIFLDTLRYDDAQQMPNLQRFASKATAFDQAWAPASWTIPSHFAVLSGVTPWKVSYSLQQGFDYHGPTLAQRFAARGYETAAIYANPTLGTDAVFRRGFQRLHYSAPCAACESGLMWLLTRGLLEFGFQGPAVRPYWMKASEVTGEALEIISHTKRPYFLALNYMDPHSPYYVEPQCRDRSFEPYSSDDWKALAMASKGKPLPPAAAQRVRGQYRAAIRCLDRSLGAIFDELQRTPDGERTVVAIVGDHGEQFGAHGLVGHGQSLYQQVLHVPLIIRVPAQPPRRIPNSVTVLDLHDHLLRVLYGRESALDAPGRAVIATCSVAPSPTVTVQGFCVIRGKYHLIQWDDGRRELFDVIADVEEKTPLPIGSHGQEIAELQSELARNTREMGDSIGFGYIGYLQ